MRGKTMFLRLFLTLLLMAGLTVDFQTMSLSFGTAAYACDDEEDEYEDDGWDECVYDSHESAAEYYTDIDGDYNPWDGDNPFTPEIEEGRDYTDDDDDCTFCDMHTVDDFIYYIESGEAGRDGIDGHVWNDNYNGHTYDEHDLLGDVENSEGSYGGEPNSDSADDASVSQNQESTSNTEDDDGGKRPEGWGIHGTIAEGKVIDDIVVNGHKDDNNDNDDKDRQPDFGHFPDEPINNDDPYEVEEYDDNDNSSPSEPQPQPEYKQPEKDPNCSEESIQMSQQVSDLYNQELFADSFNELKEATKTDTEKIFSIGRDYAGNLSVGGMHSGDGRTSYSSDIPNMVATAHSHPQGDLSCFSVSDLYSLASENIVDSRFSTIFVVGERATYAMQVTDAAKLRDFIDAHPRSEFVDPNTGGFTSVSDENGINLANEMYQDFRILLDIEHVSREDAFAHALSMLLSSQDVGVSMLKAETGENGETEFKEIKTKEVYDSETNEFKLKASECQ